MTDIQKTPPRVTLSRTEKINLGNYQSKDIFVSISIDLDDDMLAAITALNKSAPALVNALEAEVARQKVDILKTATVEEAPPSKGASTPKRTWKPRG